MSAWRILAGALCAWLLYALYLPAQHPPERWLQELRREHERNRIFWGADGAQQILDRALYLYGQRDELAPAGFAAAPDAATGADRGAVAATMAEVVQRLLHNRYAQGFDALLRVAAYRLSALAQWSPWVGGWVLLAGVDGYCVRLIRGKAFLAHSPTRFALCVIAAALALVLTLLLLVLPAALAPTLLGALPLALGSLLARAISHFHP